MITRTAKYCPGCKEVVDSKDYVWNRARPDGLGSCCRKCRSLSDRTRRTCWNKRSKPKKKIKKKDVKLPRVQLQPGETSWNFCWGKHKRSCEYRKLENEITKGMLINLGSMDCFYCEESPRPFNVYLKLDGSVHKGKGANNKQITQKRRDNINRAWIKINGIDRVDNKVGYLLSNSVPCCWNCNQAKGSKTLAAWCALIERFQPGFTLKIKNRLIQAGLTIPHENHPLSQHSRP